MFQFLQKKNDERELINFIDTVFDPMKDPARRVLERIWYRNILYYIGEQWLEWDRNSQVFRKQYLNRNVPTPVSNITLDFVRSMRAMILNKDFSASVWPNSNELADKEAAKLGLKVLEWMEAENDGEFLDEQEKIADWMILTGTSFDRTYPFMDGGEWAFDKDGNFIPSGSVESQCMSSFCVITDWLGDRLRDKRWIGIKSLKSREWVEDSFGVKVNADRGEEASGSNYQKRLMRLVANVSAWKGDGLPSAWDNDQDEDLVVFKEMEFKPTPRNPDGRYIVSCNGKILKDYHTMPIKVENGKWHYSLTDFHYHRVPGRFWSESGVSSIISPQNAINKIDQSLELNRTGMGEPLILLPNTVAPTLKRVSMSGSGVKILTYDGLLAGGAKVDINRGLPLPAQVLEERQNHKVGVQDISGNPNNVLRGQAPSSQASGVLVDVLRDAAEQSHTPDVARFYRSKKRVLTKRLILAKTLYTEERMMKIAGKGEDVQVFAFKGADLRNNTDVRIEVGSGVASTKSGKINMLRQMTESGGYWTSVLGSDRVFMADMLRKMGLGDMERGDKVDVDVANRENAIISQATEESMVVGSASGIEINPETGQPPTVQVPVLPGLFAEIPHPSGLMRPDGTPEMQMVSDDPLFEYYDHATHYDVHRRFILSSEFRTLPVPVQEAAIAHLEAHKLRLQRAQMAAQEAEKEKEDKPADGQKENKPPAS